MDDQTNGSIRPAEVDGIEGRVAAAVESMETLREAMQSKLTEIKTLSPDQIKGSDIVAMQREIAKAITLTVTEEGKVADVLAVERGGDGIDFEAARAEIGRRLDCIRERGGED